MRDADGLLGIRNRTENWTTARCFVPLLAPDKKQQLYRLAEKIGERTPQTVTLQLFWKGMRDYMHQKGIERNDEDFQRAVVSAYGKYFAPLRNDLKEFASRGLRSPLQQLKQHNYQVPSLGSTEQTKLLYNLMDTEIDVALETEDSLFIGEAKDEMDFDANSDLVLVHQLIRQYVMAKVLMEIRWEREGHQPKKIVPFIVADAEKLDSVKKHGQVLFLTDAKRRWLNPDNILTWDTVKAAAN